MTVEFELDGQKFVGINGVPLFKFTPAISFLIACRTKEEVDMLWAKLSPGGAAEMPIADQPWGDYYGSFKDKFGMMWMVNYFKPKK
jgi:uncharacterized glyoxalase superfamily protein PhnB